MLHVNPSKSNINFISPKLLQNSNDNYNMTFADFFIATVPNSKYLGAIIDNKLSFYEHIKLLKSKVSRSVGIPTKLKSFIPQQTLLKAYHSLVHSHLTYAITIWGATHTTSAPTTSHLNVVVQSPSLHWGGSKWLVNSPRVSSSGDSPLDNSSHFLSRLSNARSHVDSTLKPN